eukprot:491766-Amphidinium_carterae.1
MVEWHVFSIENEPKKLRNRARSRPSTDLQVSLTPPRTAGVCRDFELARRSRLQCKHEPGTQYVKEHIGRYLLAQTLVHQPLEIGFTLCVHRIDHNAQKATDGKQQPAHRPLTCHWGGQHEGLDHDNNPDDLNKKLLYAVQSGTTKDVQALQHAVGSVTQDLLCPGLKVSQSCRMRLFRSPCNLPWQYLARS